MRGETAPRRQGRKVQLKGEEKCGDTARGKRAKSKATFWGKQEKVALKFKGK